MSSLIPSPAALLQQLLLTSGIGTADPAADEVGNWQLQLGWEQSVPHQIIALHDLGGLTPNPAWSLDYPFVSVRVRGMPGDYESTFAKVREVRETLLGVASQDVLGQRVDSVLIATDITSAGQDNFSRHILFINFSMILEPDESGTLSNRQPLC